MDAVVDGDEADLYDEILQLTRKLIKKRLAHNDWSAGQHAIPYAGRVYDENEVVAGVRSMLDFWLTLGKEGQAFERELGEELGVRRSLLTNSGSSANLLAISALTSPKLGSRRLCPGDEVITVAAGFPTTVAPIIQCGCCPVFIDNDPITGNARVDMLEDAFRPGKTKAVMMAHTLGNPFDLDAVVDFCQQHELWLIEDNCDALGSLYDERYTGSFGDLSTQSFYPPHHITLGEGGAINIVRDPKLKILVESFRDWGRDCWCASGCDDTCGKRFGWQLGELPEGYDHKYIYRHLGYNLKPIDPQAAIGREQLKKLPDFVKARQKNWEQLRGELAHLDEYFEFMLPTHAISWSESGFKWNPGKPKVDPSWFGFMLLVKQNAPFGRTELARELDQHKIGNRMLFGGNLTKQPVFVQMKQQHQSSGGSAPFRVISELSGADALMNRGIFVGVYPGLTSEKIEYMASRIDGFCRAKVAKAA